MLSHSAIVKRKRQLESTQVLQTVSNITKSFCRHIVPLQESEIPSTPRILSSLGLVLIHQDLREGNILACLKMTGERKNCQHSTTGLSGSQLYFHSAILSAFMLSQHVPCREKASRLCPKDTVMLVNKEDLHCVNHFKHDEKQFLYRSV